MITLTIKLILGVVLLLLVVTTNGQQLFLVRPQRSLYEAPSLGWNAIGSFGGINPIGLGHMSKDELVTLLDAWSEVEEDNKEPEELKPAPEIIGPASSPASPPPPPTPVLPPPPPPPPVVIASPAPPVGTPITVRLPAFVPVQLAALYNPPPGAGAAAAASVAATTNLEEAASRFLRFMPLPVMSGTQRSRSPAQQQVRNTLDSIDAELSSGASKLVKRKPKTELPEKPKQPTASPPPAFRSGFGLPPYLANAPGRLELVPSSQIIGDWRE